MHKRQRCSRTDQGAASDTDQISLVESVVEQLKPVRSVVEDSATTPRKIAEKAESAPAAQQVPPPSPRFSDASASGETGTITRAQRPLSCSRETSDAAHEDDPPLHSRHL